MLAYKLIRDQDICGNRFGEESIAQSNGSLRDPSKNWTRKYLHLEETTYPLGGQIFTVARNVEETNKPEPPLQAPKFQTSDRDS